MRLTHKIVLILTVQLFYCELHAEKTSLPDTMGASGATLKSPTVFNLQSDSPGQLTFFGSESADLFSKEVNESFKGVLTRDFVSDTNSGYPLGFLNASPASQPWYGTMWTRDAGEKERQD